MARHDAVHVVNLFLAGAHVVTAALDDPAVAAAWDRPSVLEGQAVSGLAGHLARGGVLAVGEYLVAGEPAGDVDFGSAGEYFVAAVASMSEEDHVAIRARGAAVAAVGREQLIATLTERLGALERRLRSEAIPQRISVIGGWVLPFDEYLVTRIVEQTVHLDDLARSVGRAPWPLPEGTEELTIAVGEEIWRRRFGATAVIRALYRDGFAEVLPVLSTPSRAARSVAPE